MWQTSFEILSVVSDQTLGRFEFTNKLYEFALSKDNPDIDDDPQAQFRYREAIVQ